MLAQSKKGQTDAAISQYQQAVRLRPDFAEAHYNLGNALLRLGQVEQAILHYQAAIKLRPNDATFLNNLAWVRATCSQARFRDAQEAVQLAERACEFTACATPEMIGTLVAAYAEAGRFDDAVATSEKARDQAIALGQPALALKSQEFLRLFKARQPYREPTDTK